VDRNPGAVSPSPSAGGEVASAFAGNAERKMGRAGLEVVLAGAAFAVLCVAVLSVAPQLVEPDDYAYRASIAAVTDGHFLTLSTAQVRALAAQLTRSAGPSPGVRTGPGPLGGSIEQWVQLPSGRWLSDKDPGYPFLAAPFQALGTIRLAPLFYAALGFRWAPGQRGSRQAAAGGSGRRGDSRRTQEGSRPRPRSGTGG